MTTVEITQPGPWLAINECTVDGCPKPSRAKGYCSTHYQRVRKYGDPSVCLLNVPPAERFWRHVDKTSECWIWTGGRRGPYGLFNLPPTTVGAHRFAYEMAHGPIPAGKVIDHICRVKLCVNPDHLQAVDPALNNQNHSGPTRANSSGVRGVWWDSTHEKWTGQVRDRGRIHSIGTHATLEAAAAAVLELRNALHTNNLADRGPS